MVSTVFLKGKGHMPGATQSTCLAQCAISLVKSGVSDKAVDQLLFDFEILVFKTENLTLAPLPARLVPPDVEAALLSGDGNFPTISWWRK